MPRHFGGFSAEEEDDGDGYGLFLGHLSSLLAVPRENEDQDLSEMIA